jgi:hypothetical protein
VERGAARVRAPRREPGFAIASLAASLPGRPGPSRAEELGRQMMEVASRPVSRASSLYNLLEEEGEEEDGGGEDGTTSEDLIGGDPHSARSMPCSRRKAVSRKSLADRLARVSSVRAALDTRRVRPLPSRPFPALIALLAVLAALVDTRGRLAAPAACGARALAASGAWGPG